MKKFKLAGSLSGSNIIDLAIVIQELPNANVVHLAYKFVDENQNIQTKTCKLLIETHSLLHLGENSFGVSFNSNNNILLTLGGLSDTNTRIFKPLNININDLDKIIDVALVLRGDVTNYDVYITYSQQKTVSSIQDVVLYRNQLDQQFGNDLVLDNQTFSLSINQNGFLVLS